MSCKTINLVCPIGAVGDECTFRFTCCDGTKLEYLVDTNRTAQVCLELTSSVLVTSVSGSWNDAASNCSTNCGDADNTPIVTFEYKQYQNCSNAAETIIFRATSGYTWPTVVQYNSICYQTPLTTSTTSTIDVSVLPVYSDCASCTATPSNSSNRTY